MEINPEKTKCMRIGRKPHSVKRVLKVDGEILEQVESFKYLGAQLYENGYIGDEVRQRIGAAERMFGSVRKGFLQEVTKETKVTVYRSVFLPILTYSSESWTLTSKNRSQIQALEMRYLRKVEGKTRQDRIRNTTIRANLTRRTQVEMVWAPSPYRSEQSRKEDV